MANIVSVKVFIFAVFPEMFNWMLWSCLSRLFNGHHYISLVWTRHCCRLLRWDLLVASRYGRLLSVVVHCLVLIVIYYESLLWLHLATMVIVKSRHMIAVGKSILQNHYLCYSCISYHFCKTGFIKHFNMELCQSLACAVVQGNRAICISILTGQNLVADICSSFKISAHVVCMHYTCNIALHNHRLFSKNTLYTMHASPGNGASTA
jgi:hypothetical protein